MPLTLIGKGRSVKVRKVSGPEDVRRFLGNLGFTAGADVEVLNVLSGSLIVRIRDSRVALNEDMARRILI